MNQDFVISAFRLRLYFLLNFGARLPSSLPRFDVLEIAAVANVGLDAIAVNGFAVLSKLRLLGKCLTAFCASEIKAKKCNSRIRFRKL